MESEKRRTAESEASQLKVTIQQLHEDNKNLDFHDISEWKAIARDSKSNAVKHCREINRVFVALKEVKSELPCTCTNEHLS